MRGSVLVSAAFLVTSVVIPNQAVAQDVSSASSGVLQYFEGKVLLDDQPIEHKVAVFPSLKDGAVFRTLKGRAELLITPAVYLRVDENTSLRMLSNSLVDTRIEITNGAAILDNLNASAVTGVTLLFHGSEVRFSKAGVYRIDSELGEFQVYTGEAKIVHHGATSVVDVSHIYYFDLEFTIDKLGEGATDEFYDWARNRSEIIADKNQSASAEQQDADDPDPSGISGLLAPYSPSPLYSAPSISPLSSYSASLTSPYYPYLAAPFFGYSPFLGLLAVPPFIYRPVLPTRPVTVGIHPVGPTHWPRPISIFSTLPTTTTYHPSIPGYYRVGTPLIHSTSTVHPAAVVPHAMPAPHPVIGHR